MHRTQHGQVQAPGTPRALAWVLAAALALAGAVPALAQEPEPIVGEDEATPLAGDSQPSTDGGSTEPAAESGDGSLTLEPDATRVRVGRTVTFTGTRTPKRPDRTVKLRYKRPDREFRTVAETQTAADGSYSMTFDPRRTGAFIAVSPRASGERLRSRRRRVEVRARVEARAKRHQLRSRGVKVRGTLTPRGGGRRMVLQRKTRDGWKRVAGARTEKDGDYTLEWEPPKLGSFRLRARFPGDELNLGARDALDKPIYVYRSDEASYYGPGFYGNTTACGQTLRQDTVGVAHRKLPCGTMVRFHYKGKTRRIEVIDRGPFIHGRRWDLTDAARRKLDFPAGVDEIWADK